MDQNLAMIVDNNFLMLAKTHPGLELAPTIRVYSRISPENKAYIVKMLKKTINNQERRMRKI
jgi:magnesium-transporting ATPase (P-type)